MLYSQITTPGAILSPAQTLLAASIAKKQRLQLVHVLVKVEKQGANFTCHVIMY